MRLFVALDVPAPTRQSLCEVVAQLRPAFGGARWVRPEGMHITLKFIGDSSAGKCDLIRAALATVRSAQPADMRFRGLGFFPDERQPRVLWCGVEASANVPRLAAGIERALEPLGVAMDSRPFTPHLTLARIQSRDATCQMVRAANEFSARDFGSASETEFYLYESILKPSGAEYKRLAAFPFTKESG